MSGAGQGSKGDMKRARDSTGGGPLDHVLVMGTAGPIEQEPASAYVYAGMNGHKSDVDDSSEEDEHEEGEEEMAGWGCLGLAAGFWNRVL